MLKRLLFAALVLCASVAQAAVYSLPWGPKPQWVDANGVPMNQGTLTFYAAGTTTLQNTYTTQAGSVANANPVTLNSRGESPNEVWLTGGQSYKLVLKDSAGSTVWTVDNLSGVNDPAATVSEWITAATPTYVSVNSFTLANDQTTTFTPGRRLKFTVTAGTVYGTIYTSSYVNPITTVTMVMDSATGNLDSGLSNVSYGLLATVSPSLPFTPQETLASATTTTLASARGPSLHVSGVTTITSLGNAPSGLQRAVIFDGILTLTHNGTSLILPGAVNITTAAGDVGVFVSEGSGNWRCVSYVGRNGSFNNVVAAGTLNVTGHATLEGVTSTGATGTGNLVFSIAPTLTGHPTIEGVTSTGATGTGNFAFSASPTFTGTLTAAAVTATGVVTFGNDQTNKSASYGNLFKPVSGDFQFYSPSGGTWRLINQANSIAIISANDGGAVAFNSISTTASAANAFLDNAASNNLLRSTSSRVYKTNIRTVGGREAGHLIDLVRPVHFTSLATADDPEKPYLGFIAEEVAEVDPALATLSNGKPNNIDDRAILAAAVAELQYLRRRVADLEARMAANDSTYRVAAGR